MFQHYHRQQLRLLNIGMFLAMWMVTAMTSAQDLTIERIYSDPALTGPALRKMAIAPDGSRVTFLRGKQSDQEALDLWEYHIADQATRMLVDARELVPEARELSDEEKARRERQRIAGLRGIVEYQWSSNGQSILFPLNGDLYLYNLEARTARKVASAENGFVTDPKVSPKGNFVSFVRNQNLHLVDLGTGDTRALTTDGGGPISNGMAEFIAQEEMDRDTGYWWAPDESHIAFAQIDESGVDIVQRYEISADDFTVFEQRYPGAGTPNVVVRLGVVSIAGGQTWLDLGPEPDIYLARVGWTADSKAVLAQRQPRDQKTLELLRYNLGESGQGELVLTEKSDTWINLHHNLKPLADGSILWTSERTGFSHLYEISADGQRQLQLTDGNWVIDDVVCVNESERRVYFTGTKDSALEKHLYWRSMDARDKEIHRVTQGSGWHEVTLSRDCSVFVDQYSHIRQPEQVALYNIQGERLTWLVQNAVDDNHPYAPYLKEQIDPEYGTLEASDGQTLHYRLTRPVGSSADNPAPVIVFVYGGPGVQRIRRTFVDFFEQYMAQHGYGVFAVDNRGSTRRGVAFEAPIYRRMGHVEVEDQVVGAKWLMAQDWVDSDRIGAFGWSYGGYMTQLMMMKAPDIFQAGVAVAPVTDWLLYDTHYTERYLGLPSENAEGYRLSNTLPYADQLKGRLLVMHGMADDNVLFTHSTKLFKLLQDQGIDFQMMNYPGGKHSLSGKQTRTHVFTTIASFFEDNL